VSAAERDAEEAAASLLGILWEAALGQPALASFLDQNWLEGLGRSAAAHFTTVLRQVAALGLVALSTFEPPWGGAGEGQPSMREMRWGERRGLRASSTRHRINARLREGSVADSLKSGPSNRVVRQHGSSRGSTAKPRRASCCSATVITDPVLRTLGQHPDRRRVPDGAANMEFPPWSSREGVARGARRSAAPGGNRPPHRSVPAVWMINPPC
jgi:hypothetical protein